MRVRFAGFGGQGVVMCGYVLGRAAMLDGLHSIQTQSYGSASRGGLTRSDVVIEEGEIYDLGDERLDVLVAMSQQSYDAFCHQLGEGGALFLETDLVRPDAADLGRALGLAATDIAHKRLGRRIVANMLVLGFVNQTARLVSRASLAATVRATVPAGTEELNLAALEEGERLATTAQPLTSQPSSSGRERHRAEPA